MCVFNIGLILKRLKISVRNILNFNIYNGLGTQEKITHANFMVFFLYHKINRYQDFQGPVIARVSPGD